MDGLTDHPEGRRWGGLLPGPPLFLRAVGPGAPRWIGLSLYLAARWGLCGRSDRVSVESLGWGMVDPARAAGAGWSQYSHFASVKRIGTMEQQRLREAISSAQAGQARGYEALLGAYGPRLYGFFLRATGRHHDAEDLLGELTLRLVRRLKHYDHRGRFEPWLFRIAANMVRDHLRRMRRRRVVVSLSGEDEFGEPLAERVAAKVAPVHAGVVAGEDAARLDEALGKLDIATREVILLRHFGQMSFKEIAEIAGSPLGTVLARAHRGLGELRRVMGYNDGTR